MMVSDFANFEIFRELRTTVYPSNMAPIGLKLGQNAFRAIPDISFFDDQKVQILFFFSKFSNGRLPPEDGSDRPQTSRKRVSGDPRHFIVRRHKHFLRPKCLLQKLFRQRSEKCFSKVPVLEKLCRFTRLCRMQLEN